MKVICAGAPKTGTKSLAKALRILGYDAVYDVEEAVEFAFQEWEDVWKQKEPNLKKLLETVYSNNVEAVVDMPHSYFFDEFLQHWPNAKVILMFRDEDSWYKSFKDMCDGAAKKFRFVAWMRYLSPTLHRMVEWNLMFFTISVGCVTPHEFLWKTWYRRHNTYVREVVPKQQLLEYRVTEGWEPLCKFLNKPVPKQVFPFENRAVDSRDITNRMMEETWIAKKAAKEIKIVFTIIPLVLIGILACYFYQ